MDQGEFQKWGYGYSRPVTKHELWRPAVRYIVRDKRNPRGYRIVRLRPGAYYCSDHGRLFSTDAQKIINRSRKHRRNETHLRDENGNDIHIRLYKLMLDNWIEPPACFRNVVYSLMDSVNHRDGNCWRDRLDNIEYTPVRINSEHQAHVLHRSGRRKNDGKSKSQTKKQKPPA